MEWNIRVAYIACTFWKVIYDGSFLSKKATKSTVITSEHCDGFPLNLKDTIKWN